MFSRKGAVLLALPWLLTWLVLTSCSTASKKPKQGTPAFYWQAATETVAKRDYLKTTEHLRRVIRSENEYTQRAIPFRLAVASGLAQAYIDMASDLQAGVKANKQDPTPMRKALSDYRLMAETRAVEFAETFILYVKAPKQDPVLLEFAFPPAGLSEVKERGQIQGGLLPNAEALALFERRMVERSVPLGVAAAVGAPGDLAKARGIFQGGRAQVPRETFLHGLLDSLDQQARLFGRTSMNKPDRMYIFANQGLEALKTMADTEDNKHHNANFQTLVKVAQQLQR